MIDATSSVSSSVSSQPREVKRFQILRVFDGGSDDFGGISVGGTPHSGTPFSCGIRWGSHSSSAWALSFCNVSLSMESESVWTLDWRTKYSSRISNFLRLLSSLSSCSFVTWTNQYAA
jgi:hypothetical protein